MTAPAPAGEEGAATAAAPRRRLRREVYLVLALSLGQSAVYSVVALIAQVTAPGRLQDQKATLNSSVTPRSLLDLTYQVLGIGFELVPAVLALHFLSVAAGPGGSLRSGIRRIGLWSTSRDDLARDLRWGAGLAAAIGIPGLGLYLAARALNINATVVPSTLNDHWWTVPVLVLSALQNAVLEEVVIVGFLVTRCRQLGFTARGAVALSAVLRGSYHLYQGFGAFIGNAVMGVVFATYFVRRRSVLPLVVAHGLINIVAFVGYAVLKERLHLP